MVERKLATRVNMLLLGWRVLNFGDGARLPTLRLGGGLFGCKEFGDPNEHALAWLACAELWQWRPPSPIKSKEVGKVQVKLALYQLLGLHWTKLWSGATQ